MRKRKGERGIHRWLGVPIGSGVTADIDLVASSLPTPDLGTGAAATIVRDRNKSFLLVHSIRRGSWDCPGGRREPGESVAECAARELAEETGLTLEPTTLVPCGYERLTVSDPAHWAAPRPLVQVFLADLLAARPTVTPGDDVDAARWVSHDEFRELCLEHRDAGSKEGLLGPIADKTPNRGLAAHLQTAVKEAGELLDEIDQLIAAPAEVA